MCVKNMRSLHDGIGKCFENDLCELRVCKAWSLQAERPLKDQPIVYQCGCYTLKTNQPTSLWRARRAPHNESSSPLPKSKATEQTESLIHTTEKTMEKPNTTKQTTKLKELCPLTSVDVGRPVALPEPTVTGIVL